MASAWDFKKSTYFASFASPVTRFPAESRASTLQILNKGRFGHARWAPRDFPPSFFAPGEKLPKNYLGEIPADRRSTHVPVGSRVIFVPAKRENVLGEIFSGPG
jgi:hypothetical protein